jgi:hypothetical protein
MAGIILAHAGPGTLAAAASKAPQLALPKRPTLSRQPWTV